LVLNDTVNLGFCVAGFASVVGDVQDYLDENTTANKAKTEVDFTGATLGCAISSIGFALE
jgi:hypothetical protein